MRNGNIISSSICLSRLWEAKFSILCDVIFLLRLHGKFDIDYSDPLILPLSPVIESRHFLYSVPLAPLCYSPEQLHKSSVVSGLPWCSVSPQCCWREHLMSLATPHHLSGSLGLYKSTDKKWTQSQHSGVKFWPLLQKLGRNLTLRQSCTSLLPETMYSTSNNRANIHVTSS